MVLIYSASYAAKTSNPSCNPIDCVNTSYGPCNQSAPPWPRAQGCPGPLSCIVGSCSERNSEMIMRRKAGILQYDQNTHKISRKQQWSNTVKKGSGKGRTTFATQGNQYTNPNMLGLAPGPTRFTLQIGNSTPKPPVRYPTSSSDVPGKITNLWLNKQYPMWGINPSIKKMSTSTKIIAWIKHEDED